MGLDWNLTLWENHITALFTHYMQKILESKSVKWFNPCNAMDVPEYCLRIQAQLSLSLCKVQIVLPDCQRRCFSTGSPSQNVCRLSLYKVTCGHMMTYRTQPSRWTLCNLAVCLFNLLAVEEVYCKTVWLIAWILTQYSVLRLVTH